MRYALLLHSFEPAPGEIPDEAIAEMQVAFGAYASALHDAGVLVAAEILAQSPSSTTVTRRNGRTDIQDGPFAETGEALAGVFILDLPDLDAALGWAEKHPGAGYGVVEIRACAISVIDGAWTDTCVAAPNQGRAPEPSPDRAGA